MKKKLKSPYLAFFLFALACILPANQSYAYLDPGTGSQILQIVIASVAGALISIKMFWRHIKLFFMKIFYKNKSEPDKSTEKNYE